MSAARRMRRITFTINNYTPEEERSLKDIDCTTWIIFGKERGEAGTPHLQGACVFNNAKTLSAIKKIPGFSRAHIETMRGTPQQNKEYCSKEGDVFEKGSLPQQGKRNDIHDAVEQIQAGVSLQELASTAEGAVAIVKYHKGLTVLKSLLTKGRDVPPRVFWLHGRTGTGKTRSAMEFATDKSYWISSGTLVWFDGYSGEEVAIFDDLRTNHCKFSMLLRLLDIYPMRVPFKGGFVQWVPRVIIVTSPYDPTTMWSLRNDEDKQQLVRRCHRIWDMADGRPDIPAWMAEIDDEEDAQRSLDAMAAASQAVDLTISFDEDSDLDLLADESDDESLIEVLSKSQ